MLKGIKEWCGDEHIGHFEERNLRNLYILEMMMFVIENLDKYQPNVAIRGEDTRQINQLNLQITGLSSVQKGVCYSSRRIFNKFPLHILQQH